MRFLGKKTFHLVSLSGLLLLPVSSLQAAEDEQTYAFPESFMARLAYYDIQSADTDVSVASNNGVSLGTFVSYTDDLGGDDSVSIPRLDMYYRFNPRHRIEFSYYRSERDGERTLEIDAEFEGNEYSIGDTVRSEFDFELIRIGYGYSFYHSDTVELRFSTGLNFSSYDLKLSNSDGSNRTASDVTAPLPMFGLAVGYAINEDWSIHYLSETFFIEIDDDLKGSLFNYELNVQYRFLDHFVVGGGLTRVGTDLEASSDDWKGRINDSHKGFLFFLSYYI